MKNQHTPRLLCAIGLLFTTINFAWAAPSEVFPGKARVVKAGPYGSAAHSVEPDLTGISRGHARILLSLPGRKPVQLDREDFEARSAGDSVWRGRSAQHANSEAVLTIKNGLLVGRITLDNEAYSIRPGWKGKHRIEKLDPDAFPDCDSSAEEVILGEDAGSTAATTTESADISAAVIIDLLSVYTPRVTSKSGGIAAAEALIQAAVDNANASFANSGMNVLYRLVHTEEISYTSAGTTSEDLRWVTDDAYVASLRDQHGADMVSIIVDTPSSCGSGWVQRNSGPSFASYAFQATDMDCAVGNLTFAHEHGHNMGMEHNPENSSVGTDIARASYDFSFAHYVSGSFRTVMSYASPCAGGCTRVTRHSNPDGSYNGTATGVAGERDNAQTGRLNAPIISAFRGAASTPENYPPSAAFSIATSELTANFTDGSTDNDGSIINWAWDFGDGNSSSSSSPSHSYTGSGSYTASLQVMDDKGATNSSSKTLTVSEPVTQPVAALPAAPYSLQKSVQQSGRGKKKTIDSITLSWSHDSVEADYLVLEGCLEMRTGKGKNRTVSCDWAVMSSQIAAEERSMPAPTLEAGYHYRIKAVNDTGSSPWSNEVKI